MRWLGLSSLLLVLATSAAHADSWYPWYSGPRGHRRIVHLSIMGGAGVLYAASEALKPELATSTCRWCDPPSFDVSMRNSLKWHDTGLAAAFSNADAYAVAPLFAIGVTALGARDGGAAEVLDDTVPLVEAALLGQLVGQATKFSVGRQRPFVHYGHLPADSDDNVSFYSAHSSFTFALATGAGILAHRRHSSVEPVVWGGGFLLAGAAGYFRIAADKHYTTDVLAGAVAGVATGLCVPVLAEHDIDVVPTGKGVAIAGRF